jgi:acyl-CoA reductase-like NAD-dependent aldehyde dehydrogenase
VVEDLVADAAEHGALVVTGGNRPTIGLPGWFHEPTVLLGEPVESRIRREEIFGPVVTVEPFDDPRDAVRMANATPFALGASVWTRDRALASELAAALRAGSVWHNDHAYSYGAMQAPWGGRGASGLGRTHGREGLRALSHLKFTDADAGRLRPGWWYPYSDVVIDGFRGVLGGLYGSGPSERVAALGRHRAGILHLLRKALS